MAEQVIPAQAVEAAHQDVLTYKSTRGIDNQVNAMRAALEAAAPYMLAEAWEEGRLVGRAEEQSGFDTEMNPYAV